MRKRVPFLLVLTLLGAGGLVMRALQQPTPAEPPKPLYPPGK
jgi:hypothetical protein